MKNKSIAGFTVMLCFGSWGGVYIYSSRNSIRLCLGFVAFTIIFCDFEKAIEVTLDKRDEEIKNLKQRLYE